MKLTKYVEELICFALLINTVSFQMLKIMFSEEEEKSLSKFDFEKIYTWLPLESKNHNLQNHW